MKSWMMWGGEVNSAAAAAEDASVLGWCYIIGWVIPDISEENASAFIFGVKSQKMKALQ